MSSGEINIIYNDKQSTLPHPIPLHPAQIYGFTAR